MRPAALAQGVIVVVALALAGLVGWRLVRGAAPPGPAAAKLAPPRKERFVIGASDSGAAYAGIVANDGAVAGPRSRFRAAGVDVEIKLIRGANERLAAFDAGTVDLLVLPVDAFARLVPTYRAKQVDLRAFLLASFSRGDLGLVTRPAIRGLDGLRGAKIATTRRTPAHDFALALLELAGIEAKIVFASKAQSAVDLLRRGEVDAAAVAAPHLENAVGGGVARLLVSTRTATHLAADVLFARRELLEAYPAELTKLCAAWLAGAQALAEEPGAALPVVARAAQVSEAEARTVLGGIAPAGLADNRAFFGVGRARAPYDVLYDAATRRAQGAGLGGAPVPAADTRWLGPLEAIDPPTGAPAPPFQPGKGPKPSAAPLLVRRVGPDPLEPGTREALDAIAEVIRALGNSWVRVEGNTEDVGPWGTNQKLSKRRAESVVEYLVGEHGLDRARFQVVGNGPDKPVASNGTEEGRLANRRTDLLIIPNE